ncbi:DNA replication and repair protein [Thozetella sp. PMI_491]|nr:DNA replication and repair protein [Thozetella sp. PMI_491]
MSGQTHGKRARSPDAEARKEDKEQYGAASYLEENYPNRPRNHSKTLLFSELFESLFNPLSENKKQPSGPPAARTRGAGKGGQKLSWSEQRRHIIERFISRWRDLVGNDFYPALRLILPDKDRDRGLYGLKESNIGKLLVKLMKIDKNSEDGYNLIHWKLPGQTIASRMAGDFAGRCFEVLSKRQMRAEVGDMRIAEVNVLLDQLATAAGEAEQLPIFEEFYRRMNAVELMWLIRIILRQMKVGATEKTMLDMWHPDAEALFSVSSNLRRVCWELWDPEIRLEDNDAPCVTLMQCYQPQLAQFQMTTTFEKMVQKLKVTDSDPEFWIEEKLDGERMQMHMHEDDTVPGGFRFTFWSRKTKDYTYLYGGGLEDENSAVTRHLKDAFADGVRNLILDGEMITWDPEVDKIVGFGTLKTAALDLQKNPHSNGPRPLYRVFDILLLNDKPLTEYTLRDRHRALERAVLGVPRRLEIHAFEIATSADAIEPLLRKVVAEASEGLVLKNPRSMYRLNSRNDDWIKVKPEYMSEFGESIDCVVVGGYWGSGHRGGTLSSFLCGLRVSENEVKGGANPEKCLSFFKVGGGFKAEDYAEIRHLTEGKWIEWESSNPPSEYITLGGGERLQYEKPDVWIRPKDSIILSVKAASIGASEQFATGVTLRFPRFRKLRLDKAWNAGLDTDEFAALRSQVDQEAKEKKEMSIENRKRNPNKRAKREVVIAGADGPESGAGKPAVALKTRVFEGMTFCVLSEALKPIKKTKAELETLITANGGNISQQVDKTSGMVLLGDKRVVKVASLIKSGDTDIIKPKWVVDCLTKAGPDTPYLLPFEEGHLLHATDAMKQEARNNVDKFGDSYARDIDLEELRDILNGIPKAEADTRTSRSQSGSLDEPDGHEVDLEGLAGAIFMRCKVHFAVADGISDISTLKLRNYIAFSGGEVVEDMEDGDVTHVVIVAKENNRMQERIVAAEVRSRVSTRRLVPRIVNAKWVVDCWAEKTLLDEEQYVPA